MTPTTVSFTVPVERFLLAFPRRPDDTSAVELLKREARELVEQADRRIARGEASRVLRRARDRVVHAAFDQEHVVLTFAWSAGTTAQLETITLEGVAELEQLLNRAAVRDIARVPVGITGETVRR